MKNGKEQLIAKVQHFYDVLNNAQVQNEDALLITNNFEEKEHRRCINDNFNWIKDIYTEVFKEFLYTDASIET